MENAKTYVLSACQLVASTHTNTILTLRREQARFALFISRRKGLYDPINLLRLAWKAHMHEQASQRDVEGVVRKVKPTHVNVERFRVKLISAS
jgi:hypothetical protein